MTATRALCAMLVAAGVLAWSGPARAEWVNLPPEPPPGPSTRGTPELWIPGLAGFGVSYLVGAGVYGLATLSFGECDDRPWSGDVPDEAAVQRCEQERKEKQEGAAPIFIPVVGPFIASQTIEERRLAGGLLVVGTAQVLTAGALIAGLAWRHPVPPKRRQAFSPTVVPVMGPGHAGMSVHGHF